LFVNKLGKLRSKGKGLPNEMHKTGHNRFNT
jgi:hypothetical protein